MRRNSDSDTTPTMAAGTEPMMLAHLAVTGDLEQHREWTERIEEVHRVNAVAAATDSKTKAILSVREAWARIRRVGKAGALSQMGLGAAWTAFWIPIYALSHGFGWLAASAFLLPIPIAWKLGRRLWERAALAGMRQLGRNPTRGDRLKALVSGLGRGFAAGFGFAFTLVFLQGLVTWFMTPAPTFAMEIFLDARLAAMAGVVAGGAGAVLAPLVSAPAPTPERLGSGAGLLPSGDS